MLVVDGPNGTTDMSSDSTVTTVTPQSQDEPIDITGTFSFDYSLYEDSDSDPEEPFDHWRRLNPEIPQPAPSAFPFTGNPGFKISTVDLKDAVDYFNLFFDDDLVQYVVREINKCAEQFLQSEGPNSRVQKWHETDVKEFRLFLAILLIQGIVRKSKEEWYWSRRPCLATPLIGELMSFRRYKNLDFFFLHFCGNEACDTNKIYEVCNLLCNKFQDVYVLEREITIGELFLPSKGRPCYKDKKPTEGDRLGIKIYELYESRSGYVWNMIICTGEESQFIYDGKTYNTATPYVITLVKDILNKGYCLSIHNSYMSPELAEFLKAHKTDLYGTVRPNKKRLLTLSKTERVISGESVAVQKRKIHVLNSQDTDPECSVSSVKCDEMVGCSSSQTDPQIGKPSDYNQIGKKNKKYYKKLFRHLLYQTVLNSFVLYKKTGGTMKLVEFRVEILEELIKCNKEINIQMLEAVIDPSTKNILRLTERHFPSYVPQTRRRTHPSRICVVCSKQVDKNGKRKRKETRFECKKCGFGLCAAPCFEIYHTVEDF